MKFTKAFIFAFVALLSCNAQDKMIMGDKALAELQTELKNDWDMKVTHDTLVIESRNYSWLEFYNSAGTPFDDPEYHKYTDEYLREHGMKVKMKILFNIQDKWDSVKIKKVMGENEKTEKQSDSLIYKYKLSHLKRTHRYDEELIWDATEEEKSRFEEYKKEKEALSDKIIELPYYNSEKYSLFIIDETWSLSAKHSFYMRPMISPKSESIKIDSLYSAFDKILRN